MKWNFSPYFVIGQSALLLLPATHTFAMSNPCTTAAAKNTLHCAYLASANPAMSGKYIKIKESQDGKAATTKIVCAAPNHFPIKAIPQSIWLANQKTNISWQFSQCLDEDCSGSRALLDDKFSITRTGNTYTAGAQHHVVVNLDPNYGVNCKALASANDSALEMRLEDAFDLLASVPVSLASTSDILNQMHALATSAASGSYSSMELSNLNNQFQTLKDEMDKAQRVNTLDGFKKVSAGSITISFGYGAYDQLQIPIPAYDQYSLGVSGLDILSVYDAQFALSSLDDSIAIVNHAQSVSTK